MMQTITVKMAQASAVPGLLLSEYSCKCMHRQRCEHEPASQGHAQGLGKPGHPPLQERREHPEGFAGGNWAASTAAPATAARTPCPAAVAAGASHTRTAEKAEP